MTGSIRLGSLCAWVFFIVVRHGYSLDVSWTQYSDRASLPQSFQSREELRSNLARVNVDQLPLADAVKVRELKSLLDEVISESLYASEADSRLYAMVKEDLQPDKIALLILLLFLGGGVLRRNKRIQAEAVDTAAVRKADGIMKTEREQSGGKLTLLEAGYAEVFPSEVAQALCSRIVAAIQGQTKKKGEKDANADACLMDTRQLAMQLAQHYKLPEAEVVEKAMRKERKKLKQAVQGLEKVAKEAKEAASKSATKVADCEELLKKTEDAKKAADAKKGPKNVKKTQDVEDAAKFVDNAKKAAAAKAKHAEYALQSVDTAKQAEHRPDLLVKIEGAWLSAVTQSWSNFSASLGGIPDPSHIHVWARARSLRQNTEKSYSEIVNERSFFD